MPDLNELTDAYKKEFIKRFRKEPFLYLAPGRINLIGEHVDYNDGLVLPAAVDRYFVIAIAPGAKGRCNVFARDLDEGVSFSLNDLHPGEAWINYIMGVMDAFLRRGLPVTGINCVVGGNIPVGAGLSSSAALCCGLAFALNDIFKLNRDPRELARMAQFSEHEFAGVNCGIMDQYASLFGQEGSALLLDCRSLEHETVPIGFKSHSLMLIDTRVKHSLAATAYNDRRAACERGVAVLRKNKKEVSSLRDATLPQLYEHREEMGEEVFSKCRFVLEEIQRVRDAREAIRQQDVQKLGALMYESHWGLSRLYEVSCEELDFLAIQAEELKEMVPGARMMGGGFGGCTLNLVRNGSEGLFKEKVRKAYKTAFGREPEFYQVNISNGVRRIDA